MLLGGWKSGDGELEKAKFDFDELQSILIRRNLNHCRDLWRMITFESTMEVYWTKLTSGAERRAPRRNGTRRRSPLPKNARETSIYFRADI
jgi:hypothetical protein